MNSVRNRFRHTGITLGAMALAVPAILAPQAVATPSTFSEPPPDLTVSLVSLNGSGCPDGSARVEQADDLRSFKIRYTEFTALVGPEAESSDFRRNCQMSLQLNNTAGYSYSIAKIKTRGYLNLSPNSTASMSTRWYNQSSSDTIATPTKEFGGADRPRHFVEETVIDPKSRVWSKCGEEPPLLNVNTVLYASAGEEQPRQTSWISLSRTDVQAGSSAELLWRSCK